MKKFSFVSTIATICMVLFGAMANAQKSEGPFDFDKKTLINSTTDFAEADKLAIEKIRSISERMFRDFSKNYKSAYDISVQNVDNHKLVTCYVDGAIVRILYNAKGRWQHTVRTYENDKLPEEVRDLVSDTYPRYSIFGGVIEINVGSKTAHLVSIENKTSWKRIRVVDGEMDIYEEYKKRQ